MGGTTRQNFPLDINNFCQWVKEWLDDNGKNILFMVDEVGQFIGKNTQMMLKLQTITENLWVICGGRAWVIVTSQADINAAIGGMSSRDGQDFSKIQGRFSTRLQLSSSNTSEVIQKRLLVKLTKQKRRWQKCGKRKAISCVTSWLLTLQQLLHYVLLPAKKSSLTTTRLSRGTIRFCKSV